MLFYGQDVAITLMMRGRFFPEGENKEDLCMRMNSLLERVMLAAPEIHD